MSAILRHIVDMAPYMLLAIPLFLIVRVAYIKIKKIHINWYHEAALLVFMMFVVGLASQTVIPKLEFGVGGLSIVQKGIHETNFIPFKVLVDTFNEVFLNGNVDYFIINFLGNIVMFMPFGFFVPLLWNVPDRVAVLVGFGSSLCVEVSQLFLARNTDVDDLLLNTAGAYLGLLLYMAANRYLNHFVPKFKHPIA